jgi:hypothetical protein
MSDAFAAAAVALAADTNMGVDAVWTSRLGGAAIAVRVVPSSPEAGYANGEGPSVVGVAASVTMAATAIPGRPERNDLLTVRGTDYVVAEVAQDPRGVSHRLHLRRA